MITKAQELYRANRYKLRKPPRRFEPPAVVLTDPLGIFERDPTPANAVRLAIADHKAGSVVDWAFVKALGDAVEILERAK